ncbi:TFIIB-type zinc finger domain-containing protein [Prevotella sp. P6B4]|uniref:TFIIB-type zinc finger domain-containing protein n=1 Tax=Prevotella sp. P6B4 TaxID=1410614 RepID=UPI000B01F733|nr:TFIIB-type zinc finger domain-containing protein [Prevotella sp. P6B4]
MKALQCEMCGSQDLVKDSGVFVCQSCGTKYSVEEAKKMMIEGTVDVKGTVKVDKSQDAKNLVQLAKDAIESVNGEEAYSYANRALETDPSNADAWFIKMKAAGLIATLGDLKVLDVINAGKKAIELSNKELEKEVYVYYLTKCLNDLQFCMTQLQDTQTMKELYEANCQLSPFSATEKTLQCDSVLGMILIQVDTVVKLRAMVPESFVSSDEDITHLVGEVAKQWVYYTNAVNSRFNVYGTNINDETVAKYREVLSDIKKGLPEEKQDVIGEEAISNPSSGPCYVATAVYGSYDCPEVWTLRRFRDFTLNETWYGRLFIRVYYAISPTFVKHFGNVKVFKSQGKRILDKWVVRLNNKGYTNTPYKDKY